ncbi:MAG: hypothetical protein UR28_C0044G0008 [Candidatus Peregrinibacteria bacterium GW2011_GWF2_33_10]|nr:MAG: hypothetical protein UR28_C0044G0008 [Candidatus Peregrinibacteria bacterium GW2011_GWF2_33_10]OGJ44050.1 MAG: hypothetical protein A2263_01440 [Candidatus Peregrinibacteria bacterium RIFOXYA2_FULL_33_21]OGJ51425.1 MAG: hypothetical protein A2307_02665 [Candidatus Peregrinibacteria bacterium RIFOXYB2_FULL_33_20]
MPLHSPADDPTSNVYDLLDGLHFSPELCSQIRPDRLFAVPANELTDEEIGVNVLDVSPKENTDGTITLLIHPVDQARPIDQAVIDRITAHFNQFEDYKGKISGTRIQALR